VSKFDKFVQVVQFVHMMESWHHERLAWEDAKQARYARALAEARAAAQLQAMLDANPSGALGNAKINDIDALKKSGL
jgi:hypothetical protein